MFRWCGMAERPDAAPTAWSNPTWVLAVMHYPTEPLLLERIAHGTEITARRDSERAIQAEADRAGKVAGNVLAALYALVRAGWTLPCNPSLAVAVRCAEQMEIAERAVEAAEVRRGQHTGARRAAPRGHTKIEEAYGRMRSVAHLWAAARLQWEEYPTRPYGEVMCTEEGIRMLLGIARGVQEWAREWKPPRTKQYKPLLGADPWLVPPDIQVLSPRWPSEPGELVQKALSTYKRRSRGSRG